MNALIIFIIAIVFGAVALFVFKSRKKSNAEYYQYETIDPSVKLMVYDHGMNDLYKQIVITPDESKIIKDYYLKTDINNEQELPEALVTSIEKVKKLTNDQKSGIITELRKTLHDFYNLLPHVTTTAPHPDDSLRIEQKICPKSGKSNVLDAMKDSGGNRFSLLPVNLISSRDLTCNMRPEGQAKSFKSRWMGDRGIAYPLAKKVANMDTSRNKHGGIERCAHSDIKGILESNSQEYWDDSGKIKKLVEDRNERLNDSHHCLFKDVQRGRPIYDMSKQKFQSDIYRHNILADITADI
jgi:hypothetical protein